MLQDSNIRNWIDCWKQPLKEENAIGVGHGSAELWNGRADFFAKRLGPRETQGRTEEIFRLLDQAGFKAKDARVLDIGCGPGAIAIPLAQAGARVTGLDISYKVLNYLRENAEREKLPVKTVECSWWDADIDKLGFRGQFDLVVTSMTPAVKDIAAFDRMMACSRGFCYHSHFLHFDRGIRNEALRRLLKQPSPPAAGREMSPFVFNFMYLYLQGYRPLVRIEHSERTEVAPWEEAAERAIGFDAAGATEADKHEIRKYFREASVKGQYTAHLESYTGMMVWHVDLRK